jgi:hypothetical protein
MATMFEAAYKKFPTNDEFGAQAFMAYIRLGNWKAAQQVSLWRTVHLVLGISNANTLRSQPS